VELAKAFGSPLLADAHSNGSVSGIVKACGNQGVRYGAISTAGMPLEEYELRSRLDDGEFGVGQERLGFAQSKIVHTPLRDKSYS